MMAREIMTSNVKSVMRTSSLQEIAQIMKSENCGIIPVVDESRRLVGVVTDRDIIVRGLAGERSAMDRMKAEDVMSSDVEAVTPDESIVDVIQLMGEKQVRRIPVVDQDDQLLGIISVGDLANRADYDVQLQDALEKCGAPTRVMTALVSQTPRMRLIDARGTLARTQWANEIHPTEAGFRKLAETAWKPVLRAYLA